MAQIIIREKDLTGNPAASVFDVAFVPGLVKKGSKWKDEYYGKPFYFNSLAQFQEIIGTEPVLLTGVGIPYTLDEHKNIEFNLADGTYDVDDYSFFFGAGIGEFDRGYTYAVELLNAGIPLYYLPVEGTSAIDIYSAIGKNKYTIDSPKQDTTIHDYPGDTGSYRISDTASANGWSRENITVAELSSTLAGIKSVNSLEEISVNYITTPGYEPVTLNLSDLVISSILDSNGYVTELNIGPKDGLKVDLIPDEQHSSFEPLENISVSSESFSLSFYYGSVTVTLNDPDKFTIAHTTGDSQLYQLADRGTYNVKYLTSGGYPTYEFDENALVDIMLQVAGANNDETDDYNDNPASDDPNGRGDCVALIDHFEVDDRPLLDEGSVYARINKVAGTEEGQDACGLVGKSFLSYGAMFTPYANYSLSKGYEYPDATSKKKKKSTMHMPGSFAYMTCLAKQLKAVLPTYEAVAGVGRGTVTNIVFNSSTNSYEMCTKDVLTNYVANYYNNPMDPNEGLGRGIISINAITQINPYGMVIYGTRTLAEKSQVDGVKATGVLNIRNMVSDIKKQMYQSARRYMYSANTDALWINFKSSVAGLLDQLQSGYGIKRWALVKDEVNSTKSSIYAICQIVPIYPVEKFDITIEITDDDISVTEEEN